MPPDGARTAPGVSNSHGGFVLKRMIVGGAPKSVVIMPSKVSWQAVTGATKKELNVPDEYAVVLPIIVGYAAHLPESPGRKKPELLCWKK
jgi:hypothetical protein